MNKAQLIEAITDRIGDKRAATEAVEAMTGAITRAVAKGERVAISGFGVFEKVDRAARTARNPATGATVKLKKTSVPKFRPGKDFKDVVSGAKKLTAPARSGGSAARGAAVAATAPARAAARAATAPARAAARAVSGGGSGGSSSRGSTAAKKATPSKSSTASKGTAAKSTAAKKAPAGKAAAKKAPAKKSPASKAPAKKGTSKS